MLYNQFIYKFMARAHTPRTLTVVGPQKGQKGNKTETGTYINTLMSPLYPTAIR